MNKRFEREAMLLGHDAIDVLASARVALFGLGGVGSYAAEALARSGVGEIVLVDHDKVTLTNINRQLCALESTVGQSKVAVTAARLRDINPNIRLEEREEFFLPENASDFDFSSYDYVIDAIDTVAGKIGIAECAARAGVPMISCMGTGNKLDPSSLRVTDLSRTSVCPLARVMRRELKARGITHLPVIYSEEQPIAPLFAPPVEDGRRTPPGSVAFVPSVAGLLAASEAVKCLLAKSKSAKKEESSHE